MVELQFIPLDFSPININGKTYMRIFGRTSENKQICIFDQFKNYFYIITKDPEKLLGKIKRNLDISEFKAEPQDKNYLEKSVKTIKISADAKKIKELASEIKDLEKEANRRELDVSLTTHYIIDKKIRPLVWQKVSGKLLNNEPEILGADSIIDCDCILAEKIEESKDQPEFKPKVLSFDIETDQVEIGKGKILMLSLVTDSFKKVITWKKCKDNPNVECVKDEAEMIEKFIKYVKEIKPDILTGYFSDGFDIPYLRARANEYKIKLSLGIDNSTPKHTRGILLSSRITGIVHVDLFKFIQTAYAQYLQSETLGLDDVASELIGENKIEFNEKFTPEKLKQNDWERYFKYNLHDSVITHKLFEKIWPDLLQFTQIVQEPLYEINRYGLSGIVENYIIHHLEKFNEIIEKRPIHEEINNRKMKGQKEGAFVLQPTPGIYENLSMFDFTSMHTSIIISFNLSKGTLLEKKTKDCFQSPEIEIQGKKTIFYFSKKLGFFPTLMKEIFEKRKQAKIEYKANPNPITKARSNAFKVLSASVHGYLGFFGARYYSYEAASSVLAFVRELNKQTIDKVNKAGYKVIYADTDSVAFTLEKKSKEDVKKFLEKLNKELPGMMELELEDFYKRGIWVTKRSGDIGAKKKYALIDEKGKLKIRGFETVRRDWCDLARKVQSEVLKKLLEEGSEKSSLEYIKKIIIKVKERKVDLKDLLIKTQLKKPLEEYKANTPHVTIARKIQEQGKPIDLGMLIRYYISDSDSKLVRDKAKLPDEKGKYDITYYIEKQIIPAIENIFEVFNVDIKEIAEGKNQKKLFEF